MNEDGCKRLARHLDRPPAGHPETESGVELHLTRSLSLVRKPKPEQAPVPENVLESYKRMGRARGKMGPLSLARMSIRSKWDRLLAGKPERPGKGG